jgi:formylglycine-generating enzyme required for sulfatase activity
LRWAVPFGRDDEKPVHRVWVDAFELAAYQTTNSDYSAFLESTGHPKPLAWDDPNFNDPRQPVTSVSWFDANAYCEWLSQATSRRYRLPTEAEWERAARGGPGLRSTVAFNALSETWSPTEPGVGSTLSPQEEDVLYPWGNCEPHELPNYSERWKTGPEPVGLYAPNAYGLFNLGDNVHEWCSDWYDAGYYAISPERNPQGPSSGIRRASRGGSWRHHIKVTRIAARSSIPPELRYADYGFRVAADIS